MERDPSIAYRPDVAIVLVVMGRVEEQHRAVSGLTAAVRSANGTKVSREAQNGLTRGPPTLRGSVAGGAPTPRAAPAAGAPHYLSPLALVLQLLGAHQRRPRWVPGVSWSRRTWDVRVSSGESEARFVAIAHSTT